MISIEKAKELMAQGGINNLICEAEKQIDNTIKCEAANNAEIDFTMYEEKTDFNANYFDYVFRDLRDKLEDVQVRAYRDRIVKAYRDAGYNAKYERADMGWDRTCYCFQIHGFLQREKEKDAN